MKISQWLGYNEDASQYLLRPGELRVLNNLQSRRPGMLLARRGLSKIYGKYDDEGIFGIYRRATVLGTPSDFLWLQRVLQRRELTLEQLADNEEMFEFAWHVLRVQGNQSRVIDTQAAGLITNFSIAEDRHGRMFVFYGHGVRPRLYRPTNLANVAITLGIAAPKASPVIVPSGSGYFIENVDVAFGGGAYYAPPELTVTGGDPEKPAKLKALVQSGNVVGVDIVDGGVNYQNPPTITAAFDKVGTGFRAKGTISTSGRTIEGFAAGQDNDSGAGDLTGVTPPPDAQTYGENNSTANNRIMYQTQPRVTSEKVLAVSTVTFTGVLNGVTLTAVPTSVVTLAGVTGIEVGQFVNVFPYIAPFQQQGGDWQAAGITVGKIDTTTNQIWLLGNAVSTAWTPAANTTYEMTFYSRNQVAFATADYDPARRRFTAIIPVRSSSAGGSGAHATLEFSPNPYGYGLNAGATSSIAVTRDNWNQYPFKNKNNTTYKDILYEEYWEGSDYDKQNSKENANYIGLQASGSRYIRGYSGTVGKKRADVYWPDYGAISVWFCTGTYSSNLGQWTRADVSVSYETTGTGPSAVTSKVLRFRLRPTKSTKTVQPLGGAALATQYEDYTTFDGVTAPEIKITLRECPESWVSTGDQCLPTLVKEAAPNRQQWWSSSTSIPRPLVDLIPFGSAVTDEQYRNAVTITDPGSGWQKNAVFAFRLYRANPYDQYTDNNTAVVESSVNRGHAALSKTSRYIEYKFTANAPDNKTPHGPPAVLVLPAQMTIPGEGYRTGDKASIRLMSRPLGLSSANAVSSLRPQWTGRVLETLTPASVGQIASVSVIDSGRNYFAPPTIETRGGGAGYGLSVRPKLTDGKITAVQIVDPGMGYTSPPELFTQARRAELTPVMRATLRGKYKCAYRYVDLSDTVVGSVTATLGDSATTLTLSDTSIVKPGMVLEATTLPHMSRVKSVNGTQVEINQSITALAANTSISVTVRDLTKPIAYSDLSPIADVDAGPNDQRTHSSSFTWSIPSAAPEARVDKVELWRTSADQSLVYYRLEAYGAPSPDGIEIVGADTLTDEQLFDADRPHYAAMPVILPNGSVNAYRFGFPRSDMSVGVSFQDRLWMGVSTSGEGVNTLYYSEYDEFESLPDVNELPIQNNQKSTDVITALVPFGSMLLAMQHTHAYGVSYNSDPAIDGAIQMLGHRGCLHQRCWDIHENVLYAADESGIYSMDRSGQITDISLPLRDYFVSEQLDFTKRDTFFLQVDPRTHILRFFCCLKAGSEDTPTMALCYDLMAKSWWTESYPNSLTAACTGRPGAARINTILLGGVDGNLYEIDGDSDHANSSLTDCFVTNGGRGYREAPTISAPNIKGAVVKGVVSEGRLVDVIIHSAGWDASWGIALTTEAGDNIATHDGVDIQCIEYDAIRLDIGAPDLGGTQAVAYANFSVTPRIRRTSTVSFGEDYVRLTPARLTAFEPDSATAIRTEDGFDLWYEVPAANSRYAPGAVTFTGSGPMALQPLPVEIGMEAIGDYIPLNAFVTRIDRNNVHLSHPDGTPVSMLFGAARTNASGTPADWLEDGGTVMEVTFYKPFRTHIPFRMATGFMQLVNEDNTKRGDALIDRSVSLVYTPTASDKTVELIERYNGREEMRPNLIRRNRGGTSGFIHREDSASTVLNISKSASHLGFSTGTATAKFASRAYTDMTGEDQHVQVELHGRPEQASPWQRENFWNANEDINSPQPFVMHTLTVEGVVVDAQ